MHIFGIGIDIVETARISDSIERFGEKFLNRIYTAKERAYCDKMRFAELSTGRPQSDARS